MSRQRRLPELEFIALVAMLFAVIAFSIDAMLPALTNIGQELSPEAPENATLVIGIFAIGMGIGTFFAGPISDATGRRAVILGGFFFYCLGALISAFSQTLEALLIGRFLQGLAIAGPRIAAQAMIRDLYSGDRMAAITSFAMMIFTLVPAVAPLLGQLIMIAFGWQAIFLSFVLFALLVSLWFGLRQEETLAPERRVSLSLVKLLSALKECLFHRVFRYSILAQTVCIGGLFAFISSAQPIYAQTHNAAASFPYWMAGTALMAMSSNFINGRIVGRHGMRRMIKFGFLGQVTLCALFSLLTFTDAINLVGFFVWATVYIWFIGFIIGNLNALALEPMGHIAGFAASINGALSTIGASFLAIPIGLSFDGTERALILGVLCLSLLGLIMMWRLGARESV